MHRNASRIGVSGRRRILFALALAMATSVRADAADFAAAARTLDGTVGHLYAYSDKLPGGLLPRSPQLDAERDAVVDRPTLLRYAEDRMASLADHHAITGSSLSDSWAVVPSYADLWIVERGRGYFIDAVREGSAAATAGVCAGDRLVSVDGTPAEAAVAAFWHALGLPVTARRAAYAARVIAAGRRDRPRHLGVAHPGGAVRLLTLPSLYVDKPSQPPLTLTKTGRTAMVRFADSLGGDNTIAAFDAAMARISPKDVLVLDLRDTPSGGNTTIARAIMGWFVTQARSYQVHNRPDEERETGIARQWIEQVLPRKGKQRMTLPKVLVGRWTGSMGEGLAIGFAALGARVEGTPMAGLNGSVEDVPLGDTGLTIKLPTERLLTVSGRPREEFVPQPVARPR